jgi:hypothetical protein
MNSVIQQNLVNPGHISLAEKIRDSKAVMLSPLHSAENKVVVKDNEFLIILSGKGNIRLSSTSGVAVPYKTEIPFDEDCLPLIVKGSVKIFPDNNENECTYKIITGTTIEKLEDEDTFIIGRICACA